MRVPESLDSSNVPKIAIERDLTHLVVVASRCQTASEDRGRPAGVDYEPCANLDRCTARLIAIRHADDSVVLSYRLQNRRVNPPIYATSDRVIHQYPTP